MTDSAKSTNFPRRGFLTFAATSILSLALLPVAGFAKDGGHSGGSGSGDSGRGSSNDASDDRADDDANHAAGNETENEDAGDDKGVDAADRDTGDDNGGILQPGDSTTDVAKKKKKHKVN